MNKRTLSAREDLFFYYERISGFRHMTGGTQGAEEANESPSSGASQNS